MRPRPVRDDHGEPRRHDRERHLRAPGLAAKIAGVRVWFSLVFKCGFALIGVADGADLATVSTSAHHLLYDVVFGAIPDRLAAELDCTVLMVHSNEPRRHTFLRYLLERVAV